MTNGRITNRRSRPAPLPSVVTGAALTLAVALLPAPIAAQVEVSTSDIDAIFADWDSDQSPGCTVGVTRHGETVFEKAYGMADLEHGVPNRVGSIIEGGSVSKQFTAAAIMLLVLDGAISLDDDVRDYVPELPDYGETITIHQLVTHTSGLRDWGSIAGISGWGRESRSHDHDDVLDILSRQSALNFAPGHEWSYSNSGYNLLAVIVDRVSGMSFADFSKERIFEPLGMHDTQWRDDYRRIVPGRSAAYSRTRDGWEINRPIEYVHGNGGILSTVSDLGRWNAALDDGSLGGQPFLDLMHREGVLNDGTEIGYAGGLFVGTHGGVRSVTHTGATSGYRAFLGRYPEQGLSVAMLCNASNAPIGSGSRQIADLFLGPAAQHPDAPDYAAMSEGFDLEPYEGLYREPVTGAPVTLQLRDGVLRSNNTPLLPNSADDFQVGASERHYRFNRTADGVESFRLDDGLSIDRTYERVEPWQPTTGELAEFEGTYHSEDAETSFVVSVADEGVQLWQRPNETRSITPVYQDAFFGGLIVRFRRDAAGRIEAMSLSGGRFYDVRFQKIDGRP